MAQKVAFCAPAEALPHTPVISEVEAKVELRQLVGLYGTGHTPATLVVS
jgi:hypothetical protein